MSLDGDRIYKDRIYREFVDELFMENVNITQSLISKVNKIPFKRLKKLLAKMLQSNLVARAIAKKAFWNIANELIAA